MTKVPTHPGFFWGIHKINAPGTRDENESLGNEWEVMRVVINCIDEDDPNILWFRFQVSKKHNRLKISIGDPSRKF